MVPVVPPKLTAPLAVTVALVGTVPLMFNVPGAVAVSVLLVTDPLAAIVSVPPVTVVLPA